METLAGYLASACIGLSLGLIGGGGSIVTIPVLVYLFHIEPTLATAYSLFIVGTTSFVGGAQNALRKRVNFKSAILFALPSSVSIYATRHYIMPHVPAVLFTFRSILITKDIGIMIFFSLIMMIASIRMIQSNTHDEDEAHVTYRNLFLILLQGFIVGVISGIAGAGGGFLIIPALVLLAGLPMKKAIGTSLVIIAVNSLIGFLGDLHSIHEINIHLLLFLSMLAVTGVFLGTYLSKFINGNNLKAGFGWFTLAMAFVVMVKEIFA